MKITLVLFFVGAAVASELRWTLNEKVSDVKDKQFDINELYTGLGSENDFHYVQKDFPYTETKYYKEPKALEKFMTAWKQGFIPKDSYFSLYSFKNRHDTYRFFDVLYFAKDYDTFIKIAKWGRNELHPLQFVYSFTAALFHRHDTKGIAIPHLYEVVPHYYLPSDIVQGAYKAYIFGVGSRKFNVNSTGFEYSWYKDNTMESYKSGPKWNPYDSETRMTYYTEDIGLADAITKSVMAFAPWISEEKYPDIFNNRKGEILYVLYKYILMRYNLERYGNGLPPVEPINYKFQIKTGYNPHLMTMHGHPFTARPDGFIPYLANPTGSEEVMSTHHRFDDLTDLMAFWNSVNGTIENIDDSIEGLNKLGSLVYGISHPAIRSVFKPLHYQILEALDAGVRSSNDVGATGSVLSHYLTEMRDPVYYRVLATVDKVFQNYFNKLQPYTPKELGFPGVKIVDFQHSKLETFFENFEFDFTNSVPFKSKSHNSHDYEYIASKTRLNHKPFTFKFTINSDKEQEAIIRVFITPSVDANKRPLGTAEKVNNAVVMYIYKLKLKSGVNTFNSDSTQGFYSEQNSMKNITQTIKNKSSRQTYFVHSVERCNMPYNLVLPKGSVGGKQYSLFAMVSPYTHSGPKEVECPCGWDVIYDSEYTSDFPTGRRVVPSYFENLDNIYFKDVNIYHYDQQY